MVWIWSSREIASPCSRLGSVGAVELGCPGGGPRAVARASLLYRLLDLFSKPVFHFIRFGHLQIQNSMPTSTLCAFLVPRSSDPPGRSRSQGCARPCGRGPGGGARGGLAREGHGWGPESGVRLWHVNACWPGMEQRSPRKSVLAWLRSELESALSDHKVSSFSLESGPASLTYRASPPHQAPGAPSCAGGGWSPPSSPRGGGPHPTGSFCAL